MARSIRTITDFKAKLQGGGARPNLFEVSIPSFPAGVAGDWDDETFRSQLLVQGGGIARLQYCTD